MSRIQFIFGEYEFTFRIIAPRFDKKPRSCEITQKNEGVGKENENDNVLQNSHLLAHSYVSFLIKSVYIISYGGVLFIR